jgi:hypothetical protein
MFGLIGGIASGMGMMANLSFQKNENKITRMREDNAVQRRVADMKAAGMNPVLAAGQPAEAKGLQAPNTGSGTSDVINAVSASSQLENIQADTEAKLAQSGLTYENIKAKELENKITRILVPTRIQQERANLNETQYRAKIAKLSGQIQEKYGMEQAELDTIRKILENSNLSNQLDKFELEYASLELANALAETGIAINERNMVISRRTGRPVGIGGNQIIDLALNWISYMMENEGEGPSLCEYIEQHKNDREYTGHYPGENIGH